MRYIHGFRDGAAARALARRIADTVQPQRRYQLMEFCGGHTHTIFRYGVSDLLPPQIELVHGPGCPVCVLAMPRLDGALQLVADPRVTLVSYGDMLRVPASRRRSLLKARAEGADVRMVYAASEALQIAQAEPSREVVFFAIGFETTTPATAALITEAQRRGLRNLTVYCNHVLTAPAIRAILDVPANAVDAVHIDGFLGPSHVSTLIGSAPYEPIARDYGRPVVIAGFEPLDVLQSVLMLVRQINDGRAEAENQFTRGVTRDGNRKAQQLVAEVFEPRASFEWRGLGELPDSALRIREAYAAFDAERRFAMVPVPPARENAACQCPAVIRGVKKPTDCTIFGTVCTPRSPIGACMVSSEGACAAHYKYRLRRDRDIAAVPA